MSSGGIDVWQQGDGFWRWRYRDDQGVDLLSNESHLTREEAVHSASMAYPGIPVEVGLEIAKGVGLGAAVGKATARGVLAASVAAVAAPVAAILARRRRKRRRRSDS